MKTRTVKLICFPFVLFFVSLALFGCRNPVQHTGTNDEPDKKPPSGFGTVRLQIIDSQNMALPRTILPPKPVFSSYRLSFTPLGGQNPKNDMEISSDGSGVIEDIDLEVGKWEITAYSRVFFGGQEEEIAVGKSELFDVINGESISVAITIKLIPPENGEGEFNWNLIIPDDADADSWSIILFKWDGNSNDKEEFRETGKIDTGSDSRNPAGSEIIKGGYYLMEISIGTDHQEYFYVDVVHIRAYETTSYTCEVDIGKFVPVIVLRGSVIVSNISYNGIPQNPVNVTLNEVWAHSPAWDKIGHAYIDNDKTWKMRIVELPHTENLHFSIVLTVKINSQDIRFDLKSEVTRQVFREDVGGIDIAINGISLIRLTGTLDVHTGDSIPKSGWEVRAYTDPLNQEMSILETLNNSTKTDNEGKWSMLIDTSIASSGVYFSVERSDMEKKYKRLNLLEMPKSISGLQNNEIRLTAYFTPPEQVLIWGDIIEDGNKKNMIPSIRSGKNDGRFTFTKTSLESLDYSFCIEGYFTGKPIKYDCSNIVKPSSSISYDGYNGNIIWNNETPNTINNKRRPEDQDNVRITLDFTNDEYFESGMPVLRIEKCDELLIKGGEFLIGSPVTEDGRWGPYGKRYTVTPPPPDANGWKSSENQHNVRLSSFYMMPTVVTQKMYADVMGKIPSNWKGKGTKFEKPKYPMVYIDWYDALKFANELSDRDGLTRVYDDSAINAKSIKSTDVNWAANGWRLPTEAEWEFAARAGSNGPFAQFEDIDEKALNDNGKTLDTSLANYNGFSRDTDFGYNPVEGDYLGCIVDADDMFYPLNLWGLQQMHGNVWEMCWNVFGGEYQYPGRTSFAKIGDPPVVDPKEYVTIGQTDTAPEARGQRIIRGGSYGCTARFLRSAHRGVIGEKDDQYDDIGFCLVRNQ